MCDIFVVLFRLLFAPTSFAQCDARIAHMSPHPRCAQFVEPLQLIRRNRPQTVWVKPTSPARTDAKLADEIATESTPAPLAVVDDPPIEEDIPEYIAPTKRAGWVKASSGEEARKGTI
jgi:hypothetical protein